jgi:methyl-accepting chemotaxis protein
VTDKALAIWRQRMAGFDRSALGARFGRSLDDAQTALGMLASTRSGIDTLALSAPKVAEYFSATIADLLAAILATGDLSEDARILRQSIAFSAFVQRKEFADGTRAAADRGGAVVAQAVEAMSRIAESSLKISDIIGVIDEIARQTNLLALNAAVEAARAGEAGRGFAVVASEVRSLAQRSAQAAKDINNLITDSSARVQEGVGLVNQAGSSLTEILASIQQVADIVADIANASAEQAAGLDQINKALNQMDEVTQQNSALVEENAATAKTLENQSGAVTERLSAFRFERAAARKPRAAAA